MLIVFVFNTVLSAADVTYHLQYTSRFQSEKKICKQIVTKDMGKRRKSLYVTSLLHYITET
jgi:hypothetical protein